MGHLKALLASNDVLEKHQGAIGVRKIMSSTTNPPVQAIIESGVIPVLMQLLNQTEYPHLQLEASWTLSNVASGTAEQC